MTFVTDFADAGVLLPASAAILVLLFFLRQRATALAWLFTVGMSLGAVLALKLTLASCEPPSPFSEIHNPSGHTASATLVYGGLIALVSGRLMLTLTASLGFATLFGTSRFLLHSHTAAEAALGGGIGVLGVTVFTIALPQISTSGSRRALVLVLPAVVISLVLALHGVHWLLEPAIHHVSHRYWPFQACGASDMR